MSYYSRVPKGDEDPYRQNSGSSSSVGDEQNNSNRSQETDNNGMKRAGDRAVKKSVGDKVNGKSSGSESKSITGHKSFGDENRSLKDDVKDAKTAKKGLSLAKKAMSKVKASVNAVAQKTASVTKISITTATRSIMATIVGGIAAVIGAIAGTIGGGASVLDSTEELPIVYTQKGAIGASGFEAEDGQLEREVARRIWSTMSGMNCGNDPDGAYWDPADSSSGVRQVSYGLRPEQICAMLGNFQEESGLDPTAVETVYGDSFNIGTKKQYFISYDFVTEYVKYYDQTSLDYFNDYDTIHRAGIGLAQWTDVLPAGTNFDITNPGRNCKLVTYAKIYGMEYYLTSHDGQAWNGEDWLRGDNKTEAQWYDLDVQLAYMLDESEVGDTKASWIHDWDEYGVSSTNAYGLWGGDQYIALTSSTMINPCLQGWDSTGAWTDSDGWNKESFTIATDKVTFDENNINAIGDNTKDNSKFSVADQELANNGNVKESYYSNNNGTDSDAYVTKVNELYGAWSTTNAESTSWDDQSVQNSGETPSGEDAGRTLAFKYAEKTANLSWHGNTGTTEPCAKTRTSYKNDFLYDNYQSLNVSLFQHWDTNLHKYVKNSYTYNGITFNDPCEYINYKAKQQYICCFKYYYRYHLYRYTTLYYTMQFANEYEGNMSAAIETRLKYANDWFNYWWECGQNEAGFYSEPNKYASDNKTYNDYGFNDYFFRTEEGYARGIQIAIDHTEDTLQGSEKDIKIYDYDVNMSTGLRRTKISTADIANAAALIAWPYKTSSYNDGTLCYKDIHDATLKNDTIYMSCDRTAATAIRWSGCDDNFPGGNTLIQIEYLISSPRWTEIDWGGDINQLQPGDVLIRKDSLAPSSDYESDGMAHHILIFVGNYICTSHINTWINDSNNNGLGLIDVDTYSSTVNIVHGSYGERSPAMDTLDNSYRSYTAYRCTSPQAPDTSQYIKVIHKPTTS